MEEVVRLGYYQAALSSDTPATNDSDADAKSDSTELYEVTDSEFKNKVKDDAYVEIYNVCAKASPKKMSVPRQLQLVFEGFAGVSRVKLPPGLPPP